MFKYGTFADFFKSYLYKQTYEYHPRRLGLVDAKNNDPVPVVIPSLEPFGVELFSELKRLDPTWTEQRRSGQKDYGIMHVHGDEGEYSFFVGSVENDEDYVLVSLPGAAQPDLAWARIKLERKPEWLYLSDANTDIDKIHHDTIQFDHQVEAQPSTSQSEQDPFVDPNPANEPDPADPVSGASPISGPPNTPRITSIGPIMMFTTPKSSTMFKTPITPVSVRRKPSSSPKDLSLMFKSETPAGRRSTPVSGSKSSKDVEDSSINTNWGDGVEEEGGSDIDQQEQSNLDAETTQDVIVQKQRYDNFWNQLVEQPGILLQRDVHEVQYTGKDKKPEKAWISH